MSRVITIYRVKTSSFEEEDFYLLTDLTEHEIQSALMPMRLAEKTDDKFYDNDEYTNQLRESYPNNSIIMYTDFKTIIL